MNIILAAAFGGLGGLIGWLLVERLLRPRLEKKWSVRALRSLGLATYALSVVGLIVLWMLVLEPRLAGLLGTDRTDRAGIERALVSTSAGELFTVIQKNDPDGYSKLLDELVQLAGERGAQAEGIARAAVEVGASYTQRYFATSSVDALHDYLKKYLAFLKFQLETNPLQVCRIENSKVFGVPDESVFDVMRNLGLFSALGAIIQSSRTDPYSYSTQDAVTLFAEFVVSYQTQNPASVEFFGITEIPTDVKIIEGTARAYTQLYESMLELPVEKATLLYRYMRQGEL